jgi:rubrerythrin
MTDPLDEIWACTTCNNKFKIGLVVPGKFHGDPWPCPLCGSFHISPADGQVRETPEYFGEIGTRN